MLQQPWEKRILKHFFTDISYKIATLIKIKIEIREYQQPGKLISKNIRRRDGVSILGSSIKSTINPFSLPANQRYMYAKSKCKSDPEIGKKKNVTWHLTSSHVVLASKISMWQNSRDVYSTLNETVEIHVTTTYLPVPPLV